MNILSDFNSNSIVTKSKLIKSGKQSLSLPLIKNKKLRQSLHCHRRTGLDISI